MPALDRPRDTTPSFDQNITTIVKQNLRTTSTTVTSMIAKSLGKPISASSMHKRLNMKEVHAREPFAWVLLTI
ncbi:hypothetical protein NPIL_299241 [Nephila pilipes]|uniref:Uncharacterized protein n=1 Tax=Nephila pilipes TaxID=299642 RepID=A0A8X6MNP6_NEPPI|nr:hypothetical protein NPIL_299241 [Nephila pilipes]